MFTAFARLRGAGLFGILLVGALTVSVLPWSTASAAPSAVLDLDPHGEAVSSNTPTLSWSRVPGAAKYELAVDDNDDFSSPQVTATTVNRRWVPTAPLRNGATYWRVRAIGTDNSAGPWSSADFVVNQQAGPTILSPANGDLLEQPGNPPLLSWTAVPGAIGYTVEVDRDQSFLTKSTYTTKTTSIVVPDQAHDGEYWWHVKAELGSGISSLPSADSSYVIGPLGEVENANPNDAVTPHEDVVLDWDPVAGAASYNIWVSTDPDFNDTTATVLPPETVVRGTRYSPPTTFLNDQYYWKVRAINAQGETIDWAAVETRIFRRDWLDAPQLMYPHNTLAPSHGDAFYFQWSPIDHATHYELNLSSDPNFTTFATCTTASTTYTAGYRTSPGDQCMPSQGGTYYWRVRGIDAPKNVQGIYSAIRSFVYDSGPVTQLAPSPGATVPVPTLRWAPAREAEKYLVEITDKDGGKTTIETYSLSVTPNLDAAKSPFTWTVQARDANQKLSPKYFGRSFSIGGVVPDTPAAPLTPLAGVAGDPPTSRFPVLRWEPHPDAHHYSLNIGVHGSGFWDATGDTILTETFNYPAATSRDDGYLRAGSFDWQVVAHAQNGSVLGAGPVGTFTIANLGQVTGHGIALNGTSLDAGARCDAALSDAQGSGQCDNVPATPVLDWDPVPDAAFYKVYVSRDVNLTNLVYGNSSANVPTTTNTRWTPTLGNSPSQLPDSQAGKAYYWYVLPCKAATVCNPDPVAVTDIAGHAFSKLSPRPVLQSPAVDSSHPNDVTFTWQDYLATNQGSVWAPTGEGSHQSAKQYRIQVSTQDDFSSLVDEMLIDQATYTPFSKTYPEGRLWWRVQAVDAANNSLSWSVPRSFVKESPVPVLTAPVGDIHTGGMSAFRWQPTPFAASYRIELYRNNDVTFSSANRVFTTTTKQTAYAYNLPLPASDKKYLWRVHRIDGGSKPGNWSAVGSFYSTGVAPTQQLPGSGASMSGNDGYFTWSAMPGATRYQFEYKLATQAAGTKVPTFATAFAPTQALAAGNWQWRVHALNAGDSPLGSTSWRNFTVTASSGGGGGGGTTNPRPTVTSFAPAAGARVRPGVNFRATFSEKVTNVTRSTVTLVRKGTTTPVRARVTLSADQRSMVLNPNRNLRRGKVYLMRISGGVKDLTGLSLVAKSWRVTVRG